MKPLDNNEPEFNKPHFVHRKDPIARALNLYALERAIDDLIQMVRPCLSDADIVAILETEALILREINYQGWATADENIGVNWENENVIQSL